MKLRIILTILGGIGLLILLNLYLPNEAKLEEKKLKHLEDRNFLEKQLVGKWNHSDFAAGLQNDRNYHLLGADGGYAYRGSDNTKTFGGKWLAETTDSILYINAFPKSNSDTFKITEIKVNHISLQRIENDSLTVDIKWFRHP